MRDSGGSKSAKRTPLWEQHAKVFFESNQKHIKLIGLDGYLAELEAWLMPLS